MNVTDETPPVYRAKLRTEIIFPSHVTPSQNQTNKEHYREKTRRRKEYEKQIWAATRNQHPGPVRLEIYRHSVGTLDDGNFIGGAKSLVDALVNRKVISNDTPAIIQESNYQQVKVLPAAQKMTVVVITDL